MKVDITKKYTTRNGWHARIYATGAGGARPVHGAITQPGGAIWIQANWEADGQSFSGSEYDLIPVKTWRAWKDGEGPKFLVVRRKITGDISATERTEASVHGVLFAHYLWVHEDGTETPCGVEE